MAKTIFTKEKIEIIKANTKMDKRKLAKLLEVTELQLLDKIVRMRTNLEI